MSEHDSSSTPVLTLVPVTLVQQANPVHRVLAREVWRTSPAIDIRYDSTHNRAAVRVLTAPTQASVEVDGAQPVFVGFDGVDAVAGPTVITILDATRTIGGQQPNEKLLQHLELILGTQAWATLTSLVTAGATAQRNVRLTQSDVADLETHWRELLGAGDASAETPATNVEPRSTTNPSSAESSDASVLGFPPPAKARSATSFGAWNREIRAAASKGDGTPGSDEPTTPDSQSADGITLLRSLTANNQVSFDVELSADLAADGDILIMQLGLDTEDDPAETVLFILSRPSGASPDSPVVGAQRFNAAYEKTASGLSFTPAHGVPLRLLKERLGNQAESITGLIFASLDRSNNTGIEAWKAAARQLPAGHPVRAAVVNWIRAQSHQ